jgi:hypothetical protein
MSTLAAFARRTAKLAVDKSPVILTSVGVVGAITTAYLAGKASFQAADIIRLKEADDEARGMPRLKDRNEQMKQRLELVWRLYIPTVTVGTATVVCIIGANRIGARRAAGLAAAVTLGEKALERYKDKVVETVGERKEQKIRDEIIQDRVNESYSDDMEIYGAPEGELCVEEWSLHYFRSTTEKINAAVNEFNWAMTHGGEEYGSVADFYSLLDIPTGAHAEQVGWYIQQGLLAVNIGATTVQTAHGLKPCLTMEFKKEPVPNYNRFR